MIACPLCHSKTEVVETRATKSGARRRRRCADKACFGRVTTIEVIVPGWKRDVGAVWVPVRQLERLRQIVAALGGTP